MVAEYQRKLESGREYDAIIGRSFRKDVILKKDNADIEDSMALIQSTVYSTYKDVAELALSEKLYVKGNIEATCRNNWNFVYRHIQYREDEPDKEQIRTARRTWADRFGDCDDMSVFHSSLLMNQGIPHKLRIAKYAQKDGSTPYWQHIYVIVPTGNGKYITIDTVKNKFNEEHPFTNVDENGNKIQGTKDYTMQLAQLSGIDTVGNTYINPYALRGLGEIDYDNLITVGAGLIGNLFGGGGGSSQPQPQTIYQQAPAAPAGNSGADLQMMMQMQNQQAQLQREADARKEEAKQKLEDEKEAKAKAESDESNKKMMMIGGGIAAVAVLGIGAYFLMKK